MYVIGAGRAGLPLTASQYKLSAQDHYLRGPCRARWWRVPPRVAYDTRGMVYLIVSIVSLSTIFSTFPSFSWVIRKPAERILAEGDVPSEGESSLST